MPIISVHGLTRFYGPRRGVEGIDLAVRAGELFGFLGPNGAGKTTAIRLLLGFLKPSAGRATVFGRDCWRQSHRLKRDVGYLPGDVRLYPWLTVRRAMTLSGRARGADLATEGLALASRFGLDENLPARRMSRGMRQKLALVLALAHDPKLLVLDEPTGGLDPIMQLTLAELLRERARAGRTVFFSSHTLNEVEALCDRVVILREGRVMTDSTLDELRARARRRVEVRFATAADAARLEPPPRLSILAREGDRWHAELDGETGPLKDWLHEAPVRDFTVGAPNLETIFHAYYHERKE